MVNSSIGAGRGGTTRINAKQLTLSDSGIINESQVAGSGGLIQIEVDDLSLREGAQISGYSATGSPAAASRSTRPDASSCQASGVAAARL